MAQYRYGQHGGKSNRTRKHILYALALIFIVVIFLYIRYYGTNKVQEPRPAESISEPQSNDQLPQMPEQPGTDEQMPVAQIAQSTQPVAVSDSQSPNTPAEMVIQAEPEISGYLPEAQRLIAANKIIEARDTLNDALAGTLTAEQQKTVKEQLAALAKKWLFGIDCYPNDRLCERYQIQPGDKLAQIADNYKVPYEILMEINNIPRPEVLRAGDIIKVIRGPFNAIVYRSNFTMDLYLQTTYVRSFAIGLGKPGRETPTGLWRVKKGGKMIKPAWTDPDTGRLYQGDDPDYPLGSRWIGLDGISGAAEGRTGFAIHGTKNPEEIGKASSRGCIRLHNGDAVLAYNLLAQVFSEVKVVD